MFERDTFLSETLAKDVWKATLPSSPGSRSPERSAFAQAFESRRTVGAFFYTRIAPQNTGDVAFVEQLGWHVVDANVVFRKTRGDLPSTVIVQPAQEACTCRWACREDESEVAQLAETSFKYSRFHLDPTIPAKQANHIKREWTRNFFRGVRGERMVVAQHGDAIVGYCLLLNPGPRSWIIDLIAVKETRQRSGVASRMMTFAEGEIPDATQWQTGTQLANVAACRLYSRNGYVISGASYVCHCHT